MASQAQDIVSSGKETPLKVYVIGDSSDSICHLCGVNFMQLHVSHIYGVSSTTKFELSNFDVEHVIVIFKHAVLSFDVQLWLVIVQLRSKLFN